jgi:hypothetical protein
VPTAVMRALTGNRVDPSAPQHPRLAACMHLSAFWKHAQSSKVSHYPLSHWLGSSVMNVTRSLSHTARHSFIQ